MWALLAVMCTVVAAGTSCSGGDPPVGPARLAYQHAMVSLDPHGQNDAVTGAVLSAVYEALVALSPGRSVQPCLAERWTTPDDTTWQFRIRPGVRFHDGSLVGVEDVVASIRRARFGGDSALATYMEFIDDVRVLPDGEMQVEVTTRTPFPLLLTRLALVAIVPAVFDPEVPIGTGRYRWTAGRLGERVELERWEGYWGEVAGVGAISIVFVEDNERLDRMVQAGEVDVVAVSALDLFETRDLAEQWSEVWIPSSGTTILGINAHVPPLDNALVREAIDCSLDRGHLVRTCFPEGAAEVATSLVPADAFGFNPSQLQVAPDPARARALLDRAGVSRTEAVVRLESAAVSAAVVEFVASTLTGIGLHVEPRPIPYQELYRRIETADTELFLFGWNFRWADASDFLDAVVHSRDPERRLGMLNGSAYAAPTVDRWIESAGREARSAPRLELIRRALSQVARDRPYLPLFHHSRFALVRKPYVIVASPGTLVRPDAIRLAGVS
jgi:peptide/nickel transport system substrate-binding protein